MFVWVVGISFAIEVFKPFELCTRHSTDCDWLIGVMFWILPLVAIWHVGLFLVTKPRWKFLIYGLINSFLVFVMWFVFTIALMDSFRMLS